MGLLDNRKRVLFLNYCGPKVLDMAEALSEPADLQMVPWPTLQESLQAHYAPIPSTMVNMIFNTGGKRKARPEINQYITAL